MRVAKPIREQVKNLVICRKLFNCIQFNKLIDGTSIREKDGHIEMDVRKRSIWFHSPEMYDSYDTYKKMKRYREEWQGISRPGNIYES